MTVSNDVRPSTKVAGSVEQAIKMPDVSVIIAAYNAESFVEKAISSALDQVGVTVEVIVVDDASQDRTVDVVAAIQDRRVTLLKHDKNQWAGKARNTGIEQARGAWLAILDSDDEFELDRLKTLMELAQQTDSQLVCDNLLICDQANEAAKPMFSTQRLDSINPLSLSAFIKGNLGTSQGYALGYFKPFIERKFLEQNNIKYPTNMNLGEDYFIIADLLAAGAKCTIDLNARYRYNVRSGSMSHRLAIYDTENILREGRAFEQRHSFDPEALAALKQRRSYVERNQAFLRAIEAMKAGSVFTLLSVLIKSPKTIVSLFRSALGNL